MKSQDVPEQVEPQEEDLSGGIEELENSLRDLIFSNDQEEKPENTCVAKQTTQCNVSISSTDSKDDNEINLGYDIIADYPSSSEDATVLISPTRDELIDFNQNAEKGVPSAPLNLFEGDSYGEDTAFPKLGTFEEFPSAPNNLQHYFLDDVHLSENKMCYPDIISQVSSNLGNREIQERLKPFSEVEMSNLYYNAELRNHESFVNNFVEVELKSGSVVSHPLHELLTEYLKSRDNLCKNKLSFDCLIEDYKQYQEQVWNLDTSSYTEYGECQVRLSNCRN